MKTKKYLTVAGIQVMFDINWEGSLSQLLVPPTMWWSLSHHNDCKNKTKITVNNADVLMPFGNLKKNNVFSTLKSSFVGRVQIKSKPFELIPYIL